MMAMLRGLPVRLGARAPALIWSAPPVLVWSSTAVLSSLKPPASRTARPFTTSEWIVRYRRISRDALDARFVTSASKTITLPVSPFRLAHDKGRCARRGWRSDAAYLVDLGLPRYGIGFASDRRSVFLGLSRLMRPQ